MGPFIFKKEFNTMADEKLGTARRVTLVTFAVIAYFAYQWRDRFETDSLRGKAVVITGASAGIGEQMAYKYARLGARLLITARREARLKQVIAHCREIGDSEGDYHYQVADMSDMKATQMLIEVAEQVLGGVDYLVLNHIITVPLTEWKGSPDDLHQMQQIFDVNFKAYVYLASHALPALERSNGSIIVMSSVAGRLPQPYVIAYSASKFALDGFFDGLRQELRLRGSQVSVTFCIIGFVGTENAVKQLEKFGVTSLLKTIPAADPADTALAVIKGGATRSREVYYPYVEARLSTLMRHVAPELLSDFMKYLYRRS